MKGWMIVGATVSALLVGLAGCGGALAHPPASPHTDEEFSDIPFPPPAIRADLVTTEARPGAYWIDGEWNWNGVRWGWRAGGYVVPPEGSTLARWEVRREGATLRHAPSIFHLPGGGSIAAADLRENRPNRPKDIECVPSSSAFLSASSSALAPPPAPSSPAPLAASFRAPQAASCVLAEP